MDANEAIKAIVDAYYDVTLNDDESWDTISDIIKTYSRRL